MDSIRMRKMTEPLGTAALETVGIGKLKAG